MSLAQIFMGQGFRSLVMTVLSLFSVSVFAAVPAKIQVRCTSRAFGPVKIDLINPVDHTASGLHPSYEMIINRFSQEDDKLVGHDEYPIDEHSSTAVAKLNLDVSSSSLDREPVLQLQVPAFGVIWQKHANECYVEAPMPGFALSVGLDSGVIYTSHSREPLLNPYEVNPDVHFEILPGVGSGLAQDVLNGQACPKVSQWRRFGPVFCSVRTNP